MKNLLLLIVLVIVCSCNGNQPEPINYGKDDCSSCKMTIMNDKFGAELITTKGKVFKFDDLICMVAFIKDQKLEETNISQKLVADFLNDHQLIDATNATYFVGDELNSPMRGNAAAFLNEQDATQFQNNKNGSVLQWNEVVAKFNK